jgi:magnesium transporter
VAGGRRPGLRVAGVVDRGTGARDSEMRTIFYHHGGVTRVAAAIDPEWFDPENGVAFWVDLSDPSVEDARLLSDLFAFHELAVEDALAAVHHPKVEEYRGFLFVILHGIDFEASRHRFATHDVDFFLGPNFLVTVHDGTSRSIERLRAICPRNALLLAEGPAALMHRIVDAMVDNYRPEVDKLEARIEALERDVFERPRRALAPAILAVKRDVAALRRIISPQRDVVGRLARREFELIGEQAAYRFRDVYDHLVRIADEALSFHDRISSLLEAHLSFTSNRLNEVMKVLTVMSTIFLPLTVLTSLYGMNVPLPHLAGGERAQFWWIVLMMAAIAGFMLYLFRRWRWL